jgi:hypothetical protein
MKRQTNNTIKTFGLTLQSLLIAAGIVYSGAHLIGGNKPNLKSTKLIEQLADTTKVNIESGDWLMRTCECDESDEYFSVENGRWTLSVYNKQTGSDHFSVVWEAKGINKQYRDLRNTKITDNLIIRIAKLNHLQETKSIPFTRASTPDISTNVSSKTIIQSFSEITINAGLDCRFESSPGSKYSHNWNLHCQSRNSNIDSNQIEHFQEAICQERNKRISVSRIDWDIRSGNDTIAIANCDSRIRFLKSVRLDENNDKNSKQ